MIFFKKRRRQQSINRHPSSLKLTELSTTSSNSDSVLPVERTYYAQFTNKEQK
jgi:hypothetical protein